MIGHQVGRLQRAGAAFWPSVVLKAARCCGFVAVCAIVLTSCAYTMEPVGEDQEVRVQLTVGDTVRVLTKDSQRRIFKIASLEPDAMTGDDVRIPYSDIVFLERRSFSSERTTTAATVGVLYTVLLVITARGAVGFPPAP